MFIRENIINQALNGNKGFIVKLSDDSDNMMHINKENKRTQPF